MKFWRSARWMLAGLVVVGLIAVGLGLASSMQREGPAKLLRVIIEKVRKEGLVATWNAIFMRASGVASAPDREYSIFEAARHASLESATERAAMPEFKVIPGVDPALLPESRDASPARDTWHRSHGNERADKYSSLDQINRDNVARLSVAWTYASGADLGDASRIGTTVQTNPVIAGGRLFVGGEAHLLSIDAATGREVWRTALPGPVARRGLVWEPNADFARSRLFVPTSKGVYAVEAATGKVIKEFGDAGQVGGELSLIAPLIVGDKLIIATVRPAVEGYDLATGKFLWTRPLIDKKPGEKTELYGGVPWAGMAADPARKAVYVSTGNPRPELVGVARPGDNRNTCSVVSINTETGAINWAFQEVVHDLWDLDVPGTPIVTTITRAGRRIDVVAAVTKLGNTLLLDRDGGRPIFDFRMRRAPVSSIPFERTAAYQPALELPQPFAKQVFETDDVTDLSEAARAAVLH